MSADDELTVDVDMTSLLDDDTVEPDEDAVADDEPVEPLGVYEAMQAAILGPASVRQARAEAERRRAAAVEDRAREVAVAEARLATARAEARVARMVAIRSTVLTVLLGALGIELLAVIIVLTAAAREASLGLLLPGGGL